MSEITIHVTKDPGSTEHDAHGTVTVVLDGIAHFCKWGAGSADVDYHLTDVQGDEDLLYASMDVWEGQEHPFTVDLNTVRDTTVP